MAHPPKLFNKEISAFYPPVCALLIAGIAVPYLACALQTDKLVHVGLLFVAPLFLTGAFAVFDLMSSTRAAWRTRTNHSLVLKGLSIFVAVFLLLKSGLIYEVAQDHPTSIALSKTIEYPIFNDRETAGAYWI